MRGLLFITMKFFIVDESKNSFEYELVCSEKCQKLYDLLSADLQKMESNGGKSIDGSFHLLSTDLGVKLNIDYPFYKYFGTSENLLVQLKVIYNDQKSEASDVTSQPGETLIGEKNEIVEENETNGSQCDNSEDASENESENEDETVSGETCSCRQCYVNDETLAQIHNVEADVADLCDLLDTITREQNIKWRLCAASIIALLILTLVK